MIHVVEKPVKSSKSINAETSPVHIAGTDKGAMLDSNKIIITVDGEVSNRFENLSLSEMD